MREIRDRTRFVWGLEMCDEEEEFVTVLRQKRDSYTSRQVI